MTPRYVVTDLVHHLLGAIVRDPSIAPTFLKLSSGEELWRQLVFCILSSQVRIAAATKATSSVVSELRFFAKNLTSTEVYERTKKILSREDVRYRFPEKRSRHIAHSWFAFAQINGQLYEYLDAFKSETKAREAVTSLFPGLGLKQASMFLRDIGYSQKLCIIDTHMLWYCSCMGQSYRLPITNKRYAEIETFLVEQSDEFGVCPNVFDAAVWVAVTTLKANRCTMPFA
jgi:N-glycosylase/DNA lyase